MLLNRKEFARHFNTIQAELGDASGPLWSVENKDTHPRWFICVNPVNMGVFTDYWDWCSNRLNGKVLCYSSDTDNNEEWWGFTNKKDIVIWTLKWG